MGSIVTLALENSWFNHTVSSSDEKQNSK